MDAKSYLDFDLLLERVEDGYRARLINGPAGEADATFALPFSDLEIENFVLRIGQTRQGLRGPEAQRLELVRAFGGKLFSAIFTGALKEMFSRSLDIAQRQNKGLRLRLRMTDAPELADIPWEYLYDPSTKRFLAISVDSPIVRYLELPEPIRPLKITAPLNLLVMTATPSDLSALDVDHEWNNLNGALVDLVVRGLVTVDRLAQPTLSALQAALRRKKYHVLHFIGHSTFDVAMQSGIVVLENETGRSQTVSGQDLGDSLYDARTLRLVVLNTCEGARTSRTDPFAGVAQCLVGKGIPAVIAMQFDITDRASIAFTREFYGALADGYPVDASLAETRKAMKTQGHEVEWGTPVLYMRAPDGQIFEIQPEASRPLSSSPTVPVLSPAHPSRPYHILIPAAVLLIAGCMYLATRLIPGTLYPAVSVARMTQEARLRPALTDASVTRPTSPPTPTTLVPIESLTNAPPQAPKGTATPTPWYQSGIITYVRSSEGAKTLYALDGDRSPVALAGPATDITVLAISPDRKYLAVAFSMIGPMTRPSTRPGFVEGNPLSLQVVSSDGDQRSLIVSKVIGLAASYSADGKLVIAALTEKSQPRQAITYYLAQPDGSQLQQISKTEEILILPTATITPSRTPAAGATP